MFFKRLIVLGFVFVISCNKQKSRMKGKISLIPIGLISSNDRHETAVLTN